MISASMSVGVRPRLSLTVPVLIVGGGPVGMTLALELARRGIACTLVERNETTTRHPKMDITNSRSMELFRRLGLLPALRAAAVPETHNFDVSWVTTMTGRQLHRFAYPSVAEARRAIASRNDGSQPVEPPMRVSQVEIEPVLKRAIEAAPQVDVRFGVAFEVADPVGRSCHRRAARRCAPGQPRRCPAVTWSAVTAAAAWCGKASAFRSKAKRASCRAS